MSKSIKPTFAEVLKTERDRLSMSQKEVAEALGVLPETVSRWENGIHEPHEQSVIRKLRDYFKMTPEALGLTNSKHDKVLPPPTAELRNPYKGLEAFSEKDASDFFGRDQLTDKLIEELQTILARENEETEAARLLAVIGPSGSGKSSVVKAGLLPRLRAGELSCSSEWKYLPCIVPGKHPVNALAEALQSVLPDETCTALRGTLEHKDLLGLHTLATRIVGETGGKVVLVVDQFEELFTLTTSEQERKHFIDLLVMACTKQHGSLMLILTLRADFYGRLIDYQELSERVEKQHKIVPPMRMQELQAAIEKPAALPNVQLFFDEGLVSELLSEIQGQAGTLPLLQFTLTQLVETCSKHGRQLTHQAYNEMGGVKGALSQEASRIYDTLPTEKHQRLARALFLHLIDPGLADQDTVRRRITQAELLLPTPDETATLAEVASIFLKARLLTTNGVGETATIEVSHEALIREWPDLREWLKGAREDMLLQQAISNDAAEWEQHGQTRDLLYRGKRLRKARAWAIRSEREQVFLDASAHYRRLTYTIRGVLAFVIILAISVPTWILVSPFFQANVTNLNDDGPGSLRQAIATARPGATITFDTSLNGGTIELLSGNLTITKNLTIFGPGRDNLTISSAGRKYGVVVNAGISVAISGLTFRGCRHLFNAGTLSLVSSAITDSTAVEEQFTLFAKIFGSTADGNQFGGGIFNQGTITLRNSTLSGNIANRGGGLFSDDGHVIVIASQIVDNTALSNVGSQGGGIFSYQGDNITLINSTISGNKVTGGASLQGNNPGGGGIYTSLSTLTLVNSQVSNNSVTSTANLAGGGGIWNDNSKLTLSNSKIFSNTLVNIEGAGAGVYNDTNSTSIFTNSTFTGNTITITSKTNGQGGGGGIWDQTGSTVTLNRDVVSGNSVTFTDSKIIIPAFGGGIYNQGNLTLNHSRVSSNAVSGTGGGIHNQYGGVLTLNESSVSENSAGKVAGGISNNHGTLTLIESTVAKNTAKEGFGGGIGSEAGKLILTNTTIFGNTAPLAGGIGIVSGLTAITFCTIAGNTATTLVGGIFIQGNGSVELRNSIVVGNHASNGGDIAGTLTTYGYNLMGDTIDATFVDPLYMHSSTDKVGKTLTSLGIDSTLRDNGGPTQTLALFPGSSAIDQISLSLCHIDGITTDQLGVKRPQGTRCDIGAYEYKQ